MNRASRLQLLPLAVLVAAILGACSAAAQGRSLDARESVIAALRSTAALDAVHVVVRIDLRDDDSRLEYSATLEGEVNVASRELDLAATLDPPIFGLDAARLVIADGFVFSHTGGSWTGSGGQGGDPLALVPTTARAAALFEDAIRDPATSVTLERTEACGEWSCLRIRAEVPAQVAWRTINGLMPTGADGQASDRPLPRGFPGAAIDLWLDESDLRLRQAANVTRIDGQSVAITIALSRHGVPVEITPPLELQEPPADPA